MRLPGQAPDSVTPPLTPLQRPISLPGSKHRSASASAVLCPRDVLIHGGGGGLIW